MELKNKKCIVTGGGSGYGAGIAAALKEAGAEVWITGRNAAKLQAVAEKTGVHFICADVSVPADWDRVFQTVGEDVSVLVNNAGCGGKIAPVAEQSDDDIMAAIATNLTGTLLGCRRAAALMTKRKFGHIVNISSVCALYAWPGWSIYTAAKAGISKFSHGLYTELRPFGVRVTCVTPSWGQTSFNKNANITGASENPDMASLCIAPAELGKTIRQILEMPDHLAVPDITVQPMIQDISPM